MRGSSVRSPLKLLTGYRLGAAPLWTYTPVSEIPVMGRRRAVGELGAWDR